MMFPLIVFTFQTLVTQLIKCLCIHNRLIFHEIIQHSFELCKLVKEYPSLATHCVYKKKKKRVVFFHVLWPFDIPWLLCLNTVNSFCEQTILVHFVHFADMTTDCILW